MNNAAAVATTELVAAGADEISTAVARLFSAHGVEYQVLDACRVAFHDQFTQALNLAGVRMRPRTRPAPRRFRHWWMQLTAQFSL